MTVDNQTYKRFAPPRGVRILAFADLALPGDWANWAGYWWRAHHFHGFDVTIRRPAVGRQPVREHTIHITSVQQWATEKGNQ